VTVRLDGRVVVCLVVGGVVPRRVAFGIEDQVQVALCWGLPVDQAQEADELGDTGARIASFVPGVAIRSTHDAARPSSPIHLISRTFRFRLVLLCHKSRSLF
jgi:hypothetical protein